MRNISDKSCRENKEKHYLYNISFFENRAVYETEWTNTAVLSKPQNTIRNMHISFWTPKAKIRLCKTYCFYSATGVARTPLNITLHVLCLRFLSINVEEIVILYFCMKDSFFMLALTFFISAQIGIPVVTASGT